MLYEKTNYTSDISYLTNVFIYEYDISKCNINILFTKGIIDKKTYDFLYESPRMTRQVYIGKLCRDTKISNILKAGIIEAKKVFFEANNIPESSVLSIKNDAVFLLNFIPKQTKFGLINFLNKNIYTSFFKLSNLELYYYYNNINKEEYIDIKGISDNNLKYHNDYFLQLLKDIFYSMQTNGPEITIRMLKDVYNEYIKLELPIEFYRTFNAESEYHYKFINKLGTGYSAINVNESMKSLIDISYNLNILIELQRIIISQYFTKYS
jgi:uncharacterized protein YqgQ